MEKNTQYCIQIIAAPTDEKKEITMSITINLLPAKEGDCIHIHFEDSQGLHNIIIDSGPSLNKRRFKALLEHIRENKEQVDLLCLSHIDDDHIKGVQMVMEQEEYDHTLVKEVWFNVVEEKSGQDIQSDVVVESNYRNLSVETAESLYKILIGRQIPVRTEIKAGEIFSIGEARIEILSPNQVKHDAYVAYWEAQLTKRQVGYGVDSSKTNGDSIAFVMTLEDRNYLFLGDAHASVLSDNLGKRFENVSPVLVKLSHHGSKNNINSKLLERLNSNCFLISSEEDAERPSQETITLLEKYKPNEEKNIYCNFDCKLYVEHPEKLHIYNLKDKTVEFADGTKLYSEGYDD